MLLLAISNLTFLLKIFPVRLHYFQTGIYKHVLNIRGDDCRVLPFICVYMSCVLCLVVKKLLNKETLSLCYMYYQRLSPQMIFILWLFGIFKSGLNLLSFWFNNLLCSFNFHGIPSSIVFTI